MNHRQKETNLHRIFWRYPVQSFLLGIASGQEREIKSIQLGVMNIERRLETLEGRLFGMDRRLSTLEKRFDTLEQKVTTRFEAQDNKLDQILLMLSTLTPKPGQKTELPLVLG